MSKLRLVRISLAAPVRASEGLEACRHPLRQVPEGLPLRHRPRRNRHVLAMTRERVLTLNCPMGADVRQTWIISHSTFLVPIILSCDHQPSLPGQTPCSTITATLEAMICPANRANRGIGRSVG